MSTMITPFIAALSLMVLGSFLRAFLRSMGGIR